MPVSDDRDAHGVSSQPLAFAGLYRAGPWAPLLGGAGLGLATLCRPSMLPGTLLTIAAAAIARPGSPTARLRRAGLIGSAVLIVLSPWMIRNFVRFGEPIWTTTHGGYTLALANNPVYYREVLDGPPGRVWTGNDQWIWWDSVNRETTGMSEPQADRFLRDQAWKLAIAEPVYALLTRDGRAPWQVLGGCSAASVLSRAGSMGHPDLDDSAPSRISDRPVPAKGLGLAPRVGATGDPRPDHCPRFLLDRPADACANCSGHRIGRSSRRGAPPPQNIVNSSDCRSSFGNFASSWSRKSPVGQPDPFIAKRYAKCTRVPIRTAASRKSENP